MADPFVMDPTAGLPSFSPAVLVAIIVVALALYVYQAIALMAMAKRTKTPNAWLAWIPIANIYLLTQIGRQSGWWTLGIIAAVIPFIGALAVIALMVFLWWKACEALGRPGWWGLLQIIPVVNLVMMGVMAWGEK